MGQTSSRSVQEPNSRPPVTSSNEPVKGRSASPQRTRELANSKCQELVKTPNEATPLKRTRSRRNQRRVCKWPPNNVESDDSDRLWSRRAPECGGCCCCASCRSVGLTSFSCDRAACNVDSRSSSFCESDCFCRCSSRNVPIEVPFSECSPDYQTFIATSRPLNEIKSMLAGGIGTAAGKLTTNLNGAADSSTRQVEAFSRLNSSGSNNEKGRTLLRRHAPHAPVTCLPSACSPAQTPTPPAPANPSRHEVNLCEWAERVNWKRAGNKQNLPNYSTKKLATAAVVVASDSLEIEPDLPPPDERVTTATTTDGNSLATNLKRSDNIKAEELEHKISESEQVVVVGSVQKETSARDASDKLELDKTAITLKSSGEPKSSQETVAREQTATSRRLAWNELATRYGRMTRQVQDTTTSSTGGQQINFGGQLSYQSNSSSNAESRRKTSGSCLCHIICALAQTLFPVLGAFKDYSLPGDLVADLTAGFTVAILHIPQGMAYGLLSGVEPIYGLYVSFVPVAVMALMSKSRHASYGTFAIISMLLVSAAGEVRESMRLELMANSPAAATAAGVSSPLVITDNHQPTDSVQSQLKSQLLKQLLAQQSTVGVGQTDQMQQQNLLLDSSSLNEAIELELPSNIEILTCVCIVCGLVHITMSLLRLGVLSLVFSDQLVSSFTTAGAIHVLTSQLAGLFDMNLAPINDELFKCARIWWQFAWSLAQGHFNRTTAMLSLASILFLLTVKELIEPKLRQRFKRLTCLPSELILMAVLVGGSTYFKLASQFQVKIIGHVPSGLPEPKVPNLELVPYVWKDSICIALVSFAINLSIARTYAKKFRYGLDPNQELFALGSANLIGSFFSCFPCAASLSRSSVQSSLNVKSQLSSVFSCCLVFLIVCYFAHILHDLPKSTLSCIIVVALKGILMQLGDFYENWRLSKLDALVWIITFVSVITTGVTLGLVLGILSSLLMIFFRLLTPNYSVLARLPNTEIYIDKEAFAECEEIEQVRIFRFNSALCYLNRTILKAKVEKLLPGVFEPAGFRAICSQFHHAHQHQSGTNERPKRIKFLIIDCSALAYCDFAGAVTLIELIDDLADKKVCVLLAACPLKLIVMIEKMQRGTDVLSTNVYPTISDAVGQIKYLQSAANDSKQTKPSNELTSDSFARPSSLKPSESAKAGQENSIINLS